MLVNTPILEAYYKKPFTLTQISKRCEGQN